MAQGEKRTRSQVVLPDSDVLLDRSPLKNARSAARNAARDIHAGNHVDKPNLKGSREESNGPVDRVEEPRTPPRHRRTQALTEGYDETEDEILLSPQRLQIPYKRASPLLDQDMVFITEPQGESSREAKRPRTGGGVPDRAFAIPSHQLDLASLVSRPFPRGRSRSRSRSPKKPSRSQHVSPSRAQSVPMFNGVDGLEVPHIDLRTGQPSPWRSSPTKKLMRIASQPPLGLAEQSDYGRNPEFPTAQQPGRAPSENPPARQRATSQSRPVPPVPLPPVVIPSTPSRRSRIPHAPNLPLPQSTVSHLPASSRIMLPKPLSIDTSSTETTTRPPPGRTSEPSSPLSPLTPLPSNTPFFGRTRTVPSAEGAGQDADEGAIPVGAFDFPPPDSADDLMDTDEPTAAAIPAPFDLQCEPPPEAVEAPSKPSRPPSAAPSQAEEPADALPRASGEAKAKIDAPPFVIDVSPMLKKGGFTNRMKTKDGATCSPTAPPLASSEPAEIPTATREGMVAGPKVPTATGELPGAMAKAKVASGRQATSVSTAAANRPPTSTSKPPVRTNKPAPVPRSVTKTAGKPLAKASTRPTPQMKKSAPVPVPGVRRVTRSSAGREINVPQSTMDEGKGKGKEKQVPVLSQDAPAVKKLGDDAHAMEPNEANITDIAAEGTLKEAKEVEPQSQTVGAWENNEEGMVDPKGEQEVEAEQSMNVGTCNEHLPAEPPGLPLGTLDTLHTDAAPFDSSSPNTGATSDDVHSRTRSRFSFAAPTSSSLAKSRPKSRPSSPVRGETTDRIRMEPSSATSDTDTAPVRGRQPFKTPAPPAKPRLRASSAFASGSRTSAAAVTAPCKPTSIQPAARGTITSFFQPKEKSMYIPATPAPESDDGRPKTLSTLERALERLAAPAPSKRDSSRPSTSLGFNSDAFTSEDDDSKESVPASVISAKPLSRAGSSVSANVQRQSLKRTAKDAALSPCKPASTIGHKRRGSIGAPLIERASSVPAPSSVTLTSQSGSAASTSAKPTKQSMLIGRADTSLGKSNLGHMRTTSFGHSLRESGKRAHSSRSTTGIMGVRAAIRASKQTPLAMIEGSPVKPSSQASLEQTSEAMEHANVDEQNTVPGRSSRPSPSPLPRLPLTGTGASRSDTEEEVFLPTVPTDAKDKGKDRDRDYYKHASRRVSMASAMLTQSLEELPRTPPLPLPKIMGPPPAPPSAGMRTRQTTTAASGHVSGPSSTHEPPTKKVHSKGPSLGVLDGSVIFVDVRTDDGDDAGSLFSEMLQGLGARLVTRVGPTCTHIVFKNGLMSTVTRWRVLNDPKPHVIGIGWVVACAEQRIRVDEAKFKVDLEDFNLSNTHKRRRSMLPKHIFAPSDGTPVASVPQSTPIADGESGLTSLPLEEDNLPPLERARRRRSLAVPQYTAGG